MDFFLSLHLPLNAFPRWRRKEKKRQQRPTRTNICVLLFFVSFSCPERKNFLDDVSAIAFFSSLCCLSLCPYFCFSCPFASFFSRGSLFQHTRKSNIKGRSPIIQNVSLRAPMPVSSFLPLRALISLGTYDMWLLLLVLFAHPLDLTSFFVFLHLGFQSFLTLFLFARLM